MSEAPTIKAPYVIVYGTHEITVDAGLISRVSSKFRELYEQNPERLVVEDTHEDFKIFMAFLTAAQRWAYTRHYYWTPRVVKLAEEWGAPSVADHYSKNYPKEINAEEAVSALVSAIDEDNDDEITKAIEDVSLVLPEALEDERMERIPMFILYQVIDAAEAEGFEVKDLIPFVFRIFEKNPSLAVPLVLRVDFDAITEEQYSKLFCQPEIHEQNINFFAAAAMSSVNQYANAEIRRFKTSFKNTTKNSTNALEMGEINPQEGKESTIVEDITNQRNTDLDKYRVQLKTQQDTINDLVRALDCQQKALVQSIKRAYNAPSNEELMKQAQEELQNSLEQGRLNALDMINKDADHEQEVLNEMMAQAKAKLDAKLDSLPPLPQDIYDSIDDYRNQFDAIQKRLAEVQKELLEARSLMAAKIVRDKLRFDEFLRKTDNRFKIFEAGPDCQLEIRPEDVEEAEKKVREMEEELEKVCPIIGKPVKARNVEPEPEPESEHSSSSSKSSSKSSKSNSKSNTKSNSNTNTKSHSNSNSPSNTYSKTYSEEETYSESESEKE